MNTFYEDHVHKDLNFPFIFHLDTLKQNNSGFRMHWHENLELLYFIEGSGIVACDTEHYAAKAGDIAVVNSNNLHWIKPVTQKCTYYCLIIDKSFSDSFDLFISDTTFKNIINDSQARDYFDVIVQEMLNTGQHYKTAVKATIISLMVHMCRNYAVRGNVLKEKVRDQNKIEKIKESINYIKEHYTEKLSIDEICKHIGYSKYYFCREFKEIAGKTVVDYINSLRCSYGRILLASGKYNVSECAEAIGFNNLSYFCKTYKKYTGKSPSEQVREINGKNKN
jgi:AraC-like DNA-binding protein